MPVVCNFGYATFLVGQITDDFTSTGIMPVSSELLNRLVEFFWCIPPVPSPLLEFKLISCRCTSSAEIS